MRKSIIIVCAAILIFCIWLVLHRKTEPTNLNLSEAQTSGANQQPAIRLNQIRNTKDGGGNVQNGTNALSVPPGPTASEMASLQQRELEAWQVPIDFYGKVVDENSNAVAGTKIGFQWVETPSQEGTRSANTESDQQGLFSLHGKHGPSLEVWFSKDGYYSSHHGQMGFNYALGPDIISPDPKNPIIFVLRKKGVPDSLITTTFPVGIGQIAQLHHDGTPIELDLYHGTQVSSDNGQLKLEFWRSTTSQNANKFDWRCQLSVPNGGLVETPEEFDFEAPKIGYQPSVVIDIRATNEPWIGEIRNKYYMQLPDGNYGRFDFYLLSHNGVFTIQSAINPTGSRSLEPTQ